MPFLDFALTLPRQLSEYNAQIPPELTVEGFARSHKKESFAGFLGVEPQYGSQLGTGAART